VTATIVMKMNTKSVRRYQSKIERTGVTGRWLEMMSWNAVTVGFEAEHIGDVDGRDQRQQRSKREQSKHGDVPEDVAGALALDLDEGCELRVLEDGLLLEGLADERVHSRDAPRLRHHS
jgi:hypothetical protein